MANITGATSFFPTASETYSNNLSSSIAAGAATVPVNAATAYADGDLAVLTVDPGTANEATFAGIKASSPDRFTGCIWTEGNTGVGHTLGATVTDYDSATHNNLQSKGMLVQHNQDGTHKAITAPSITTTGLVTAGTDISDNGIVARTVRSETIFPFVQSGGIWSLVSGFNGTMTALVAYINGYRVTLAAVATRAFTASKDTYVDLLMTGATPSLVYTEVANNAASPALAANSLRLGIVITSGAAITYVNQGDPMATLPVVSSIFVTKVDTNGVLIYPNDPQQKLIGHRYINGTSSTASATDVLVTGLECPVIIPANRDVKVTIDIELGQLAAVYADLSLYDGAVPAGTLLNWKRNWYNDAAGRAHEVCMVTVPKRLSAGLHTLRVGYHAEGGGTASYNSSGGYSTLDVELV